MFDLRYHVASLAAVFLALIIGILVGVGISDRGLVDSAKSKFLQDEVASLQRRLDNKSTQSTADARERAAAQTFMAEDLSGARPQPAEGEADRGRLRRVGQGGRPLLCEQRAQRCGGPAGALAGAEGADRRHAAGRGAQEPAGRGRAARKGQPRSARPRARPGAGARRRHAALGLAHRDDIARASTASVATRCPLTASSSSAPPIRSAARTTKFLLGLYEGLGSTGVPAVGAEQTDAADSATAVFRQAGLSTVDDVDTPVGRLALLLLLAGSPARPVRRQGLRGRRRAAAAAAQARPCGWLSRSSS